ncbi:MAG: hypothetical protein N3A54_04465 [Patescibacteria group bacterium]|nr:hypothetical protein [Patescibacteria group bacterium]
MQHTKKEADNLPSISISTLNKEGFFRRILSSGRSKWTYGITRNEISVGFTISTLAENSYIHFSYTQTDSEGNTKDFDYKIQLTTTPCKYGGVRYWFICSLSTNGNYCGRRVGVLYKAGNYFACRHCYNLTYKSRNENRKSKSSLYASMYFLTGYEKLQKLEEQIKRRRYAGEPTKKQVRIEKLQAKLLGFSNLLRKSAAL